MKSILLHIDDDPCMEARLQVAMDIARACDGHITCLQSVSFEIFAPGDFYGAAMAAAIPQIREAAEALRAKIEADLANEDVAWEWRFLYGMAEQRLLEQAPLHDVIVIGPHDIGEHEARGPSAMAGALAIRAPVPVLVVPGDCKRLDLRAPMMVAWNGSAESAVALRAATGLLALSDNVTLASVTEKDARERVGFPVTEAARYLSRHGIEAEVVEIPHGSASVADTLMLAARMRECGLLVMGAYGHSRLAELLMGGVTRKLLSDPEIPVLIAH